MLEAIRLRDRLDEIKAKKQGMEVTTFIVQGEVPRACLNVLPALNLA